jgi:hypothetical protein
VADYRGPEFHEPTPEVVPYLMEVWDSTSAKLILFGLAWLRSTITMFVMYHLQNHNRSMTFTFKCICSSMTWQEKNISPG